MAEVISLDKAREDRKPHSVGDAQCLGCQHKWVAMSETGVTQLECPSCGLLKGVYSHPAMRDGLEYRCKCGNDLYRICEEGIYCANCGVWHRPFD